MPPLMEFLFWSPVIYRVNRHWHRSVIWSTIQALGIVPQALIFGGLAALIIFQPF